MIINDATKDESIGKPGGYNLVAIIEEGKINELIVASKIQEESLQGEIVNVTGKEVAIGYSYSNGVFSAPVKTAEEERSWRDSELQSSDFIVPLTDHPQHTAYMTYRQELRDYPLQSDFPNGTRPLKP